MTDKKRQLREQMLQIFRQTAVSKNQEVQKISLEDLLDKNDKERVLLVLKESIGDCYIITSLLPEIKLKYPDASIYIATDPKYFEVFEMNECVKKTIPWSQELENELLMTGVGDRKPIFNNFHNIGLTTQRSLAYLSSKY